MKRAIFWTFVFLILTGVPLVAAFADDEEDSGKLNPFSTDLMYTSAKNAIMATSLEGIKVFAERAMQEALHLQDEAIGMGNEGLAGIAQGVYTCSKRAAMALSIDQAHDYSVQALSFAQKAQAMLKDAFEEERQNVLRTNFNKDDSDPAHDVYYEGRLKESITAY